MLTYPGAMDKKELHAMLNRVLKQLCTVKIAHEHYKDGGLHTHACVDIPRKVDVKNSRFFDYNGIHPNITVPMSVDHWRNQVKYLEKEDPEVYGEIVVKKTKDEEFTEACEYVKACKTKREIYLLGPHTKTISGKVTFFENYWQHQAVKKHAVAAFPLNTEKIPMITDWSVSHFVWGKSGTGKTQWALGHFKTPLLVSHMDKLKEFDALSHDGIVFDDMSFKHMPKEAIIHLLDVANDREIHARYDIAEIPAGTKKIFCHNNGDIFFPIGLEGDQMAAIMRRYVEHVVKQPLF